MSGVELIVAALAAGASAGATNAATSAVQDTYSALKELLRHRLGGRGEAQDALEAEEGEPEVWQERLAGDLVASGAAADVQVLAAAQRVLALADPQAAARYAVDLREAKGVQVGDNNTQHNTFG